MDGFLLIDLSGTIREVNDSFCQLLGYTRDELIGKHLSSVDAVESEEDVAGHIEELTRAGSLRFEARHVHKNGSIIDVEVSCNYSPSHGGAIFAFFRDITGKKRNLEALLRSQERYKNIVESQTEFVDRYLPGGILTYVNEALARFAGVPAENLLGKSFYPFIHDDEREEVVRRIESVSREYPVVENENKTVMPDGTVRWSRWTHKGIFDENGTLIEYQSVGHDITARKQAEEALISEKALLRSLIDSVDDLIYFKDIHGNYLGCNKASERFIGLSESEQAGKSDFDLIDFETAANARMHDTSVIDSGVVDRCEEWVTSPDGKKVLLDSMKAPIYRPDGQIIGLVGISRDISDRHRLEEQRRTLEKELLHAQKLESLGVMAGGIAHDFNNLLAVIIGHCSLAKMRPEAAAANHIPRIETAAEHAAELCRQMLAYAGKALLVESRFDLKELVAEMVLMVKSVISQNAGIQLDLADVHPVSGDAGQIRQVVMNLIINASEAIGMAHGEIIVSLTNTVIHEGQLEKDYLGKAILPGWYDCLEVTDNGCGMDDETQQRLFEPFYSTKFTGRGLGMSAVLGIITSHKGALQLKSRPGRGSTFRVYLPALISESEQEDSLLQDVPAPWKGSGTVLVVEDEEGVMLVAETMLRELGFAVVKASDGRQGLEMYRKNAPHITLVLTDIGMPVMNGYEMIPELKKINPGLPIIVSSGFGDAEIASRIDQNTIAGLIVKPYNFCRLRELFKSVVESNKSAQE